MSAAISIDTPPRKRFTRGEYERLLELEVFACQRLELIDGELIDKMGLSPLHAVTTQLLMKWLIVAFQGGRVLCQAPIDAATPDRAWSIPEPDISLLIEGKPDFRHRPARGNELLLAIEVSDTTYYSDATIKRDLYARAGVPEYWVVDLNGRRVIVHRAPKQGIYTQTSILGEKEAITIEGHSIAITQLLPSTPAC